MSVLSAAQIDVAILCGGEGKRLRSVVSDRPKPLADVAGKPFLAHLIAYAAGWGFRRFVLCAGYKADPVRGFARGMSRNGLSVECSIEPEPLGTGGALRFAAGMLSSDPVLVMNGDSLIEADLAAFLLFFLERRASAVLTLARVPDASRFGRIEAQPSGQVLSFEEKTDRAGEGWINGGIYLVSRRGIENIPADKPQSLERDLFPSLVGKGLFGMKCDGRFVDIGVPEGYLRAQAWIGEASRRGLK